MSDAPKKSKQGMWFWALAFLMMVSAAIYQRLTGPANPLRGSVNIGGQQLKYRLPRSAENIGDASIVIPDPGAKAKDIGNAGIVMPEPDDNAENVSGANMAIPAPGVSARVLWRRYPTDDPFNVVFMSPESDGEKKILKANIPPQQAAGKVEYRIEIDDTNGQTVISDNGETVILRFKGPVSAPLLLSHIFLMFAAMLTSTRAGLGALSARREKILPWATLGLILVGGFILGAFVQKQAFGAYWTGWPLGWDVTDNKTLIMFIGWLIACLLINRVKLWRLLVPLAAVITLIVYLIPHSLRGSQLDYQQGAVQLVQTDQ